MQKQDQAGKGCLPARRASRMLRQQLISLRGFVHQKGTVLFLLNGSFLY